MVSSAKTTTVTASSNYLSTEESSVAVTESVSSTDTSMAPDETSTTVLPTSDGTTTDSATTTESATAPATITTSEAPSTPTFIRNGGFEDSSISPSPWELYNGEATISVVCDVKHDGRNSVLMIHSQRAIPDYLRQRLQGPITAGVAYTMSAWVKATPSCPYVLLQCSYQSNNWESSAAIDITAAAGQWTHVSSTCTYTQEQINSGDLYLMVGLGCFGVPGNQGYIDTVDFSA
ncbi:hypothetical protein FBEOM_13260 [Fusarium beomiforme]|uniref:CBM-cenC domain-containing protein n=1 Tax=Fusarium beomiforme TaxID=44412 RepID=A0A9P5A693_9HYPO|nr:hypothetical protein FBEOM_13260 [Fusarium beomiforme]